LTVAGLEIVIAGTDDETTDTTSSRAESG